MSPCGAPVEHYKCHLIFFFEKGVTKASLKVLENLRMVNNLNVGLKPLYGFLVYESQCHRLHIPSYRSFKSSNNFFSSLTQSP